MAATKTNFDTEIFNQLITRGSTDYSPNNIRTITIAPSSIECHYFFNDRNGKKVILDRYSSVAMQDTYKNIFGSFAATSSNDGVIQHTCQNVEEITFILQKGDKVLAPKDILIIDMLSAGDSGSRIKAAEVKHAKDKILHDIDNLIESTKTRFTSVGVRNPKSMDMLNAIGAENTYKLLVSTLKNPQYLDILHRGLRRLNKITVVYPNGTSNSFTIPGTEDGSWHLEIGQNASAYPTMDGVYKKGELTNVPELKGMSKEEKEIRLKYKPVTCALKLIELKYLNNTEKNIITEEIKESSTSNPSSITAFNIAEKTLIKLLGIGVQTQLVTSKVPTYYSPIVYKGVDKYDTKNLAPTVQETPNNEDAYRLSIQSYTKAINSLVVDTLTPMLQIDIICKALHKKYGTYIVEQNGAYTVTSVVTAFKKNDVDNFLNFYADAAVLYQLYANDYEVKVKESFRTIK